MKPVDWSRGGENEENLGILSGGICHDLNADVQSLTCSAFGTGTDICVLPVLASTTILAWLAQTLIDVGLTQAASVAGVAVTSEGCQAILTGAIVAGVRVAFVDVDLTVLACVTWMRNGGK